MVTLPDINEMFFFYFLFSVAPIHIQSPPTIQIYVLLIHFSNSNLPNHSLQYFITYTFFLKSSPWYDIGHLLINFIQAICYAKFLLPWHIVKALGESHSAVAQNMQRGDVN